MFDKSNRLYSRIFSSCAVGIIGLASFGAANADETEVLNPLTDSIVTDSPIVVEISTIAPVAIPEVKKENAVKIAEEPIPSIEVEVKKEEPKPTPVKEKTVELQSKPDDDQTTEENNADENDVKVDEEKVAPLKVEAKTEVESGDKVDILESASAPGFTAPLEVMNKTSDFGYRIHPISGTSKLHKGVDYAGSCGTPIYAPADGIVTHSSWKNGSAGNVIEINHSDFKDVNGTEINNIVTNYYHLSNFGVNVGDKVEQGQFIGEIGTTGGSTGCHLHWEVEIDGNNIDPVTLLNSVNSY